MRYTLIELVQTLLAAMDSDAVDSINDTTESYQLALLLKSVYYDLAVDLQLPEHEGLFRLVESGSSTTPTIMTAPSDVMRIDWIRYDNILATTDDETYSNWVQLDFMDWPSFLEYTNGFRSLEDNVDQVTFTNNSQTFNLMYHTDRFPKYFSSTDDYSLVFDAINTDEDAYLLASKTMCFGSVYPTFTLTDNFEPDLDPTQFSYYINRAKVRAFAELKQAQNQEAASEVRTQKIRTQRNKRLVPHLCEIEKLRKYGEILGMSMEAFAAFEDEEEAPKKRELVIQGRKFTAVAIPPHAFWEIKPEKGPCPKQLSGVFTSIFEVERSINGYLNGKHAS